MTESEAFAAWNVIQRTDAHNAGQRLYFTGKPCKHGHWSQRTVATGVCIECNRTNALKFRNGRVAGGLTRITIDCHPADVAHIRDHVAALNVARELEQPTGNMTAVRLSIFPDLKTAPPGYVTPKPVLR